MGKIDRAALRQKIQQLEGLTDDERAALLELAATKRYGLVWEEREEAVEERLREELPVLIEGKELALLDGGKEAPNHILIEGDNLEALTTLSYTHEGKVDVIYIDPPYNTGNKDFVYNDSFVDSEDSYRHSKWLSFMSKRLRIAKRLLSDRGVIFISIDDNEQANLKLLCDEVFGEKKFVANIIWQKKTGAADARGIAVITEYIMIYCKNEVFINEIFAKNKEAFDIKRYKYTDAYFEERGPFYYDSLDRGSVRYSDSLNYSIAAPDGTTLYPNDRTEFANDGWTWKWSEEKVKWGLLNGFIDIAKNQKKRSGWSVRYKIYLNVDNEGNLIKKNVPFKNMICDVLNADAANDIKSIFESKVFSFPKLVDLIKQIIRYIEDCSSTILDFFAGSGTTLHAVMLLNKEDGGRRQCILVTNNENNICRDVTYERNRRVIEGYTTPKGVQVEGLRENNLLYYRTHLLPRERTNRNMRRLVAASTDLLCIKENIFDEFQVSGFKFQARDARLFSDGERAMMVIYNEEVIPEVVDWLQTAQATNALTHSRTNAIKVYVFSPGAYAWDDDFAEVIDKVELCALPEAIYQAYKSVLPKKRARRETTEGSPKDVDKNE